nr:CAP domain-containing protein [uncultured Oscillibacter sp.]
MNSMKKRAAAALTAGILAATLTIPALAADSIRISSYKGNTLQAGDRSGLIIGGVAQSVTSASPEIVTVENAGGLWAAVAKSDGTAVLTVTGIHGETASLTLTVGDPALSTAKAPAPAADLEEAWQEIIRLTNEVRLKNGAAELQANDALMDAAQTCSDRLYTWHHTREECEAVASCGYPYGFGTNLTVFTGTVDVAHHAVDNLINSPGHFQTMIDPDADSIGVGVTQSEGMTYCYMFIGKPNSINPYG